jgi:hypothetical protein
LNIQNELANRTWNNKNISAKEYKNLSTFALNYLFRDPEADSVKFFQNVIDPELKLLENPKFLALMTDVAINTSDVGPRFKMKPTRESKTKVTIPALDRFRDLLVTLHSPGTQHQDIKDRLVEDMELSLNLSSEEKAVAFKLVDDSEFMLRYQVVSMARNHNFFGSMDVFMKNFARICMDTQNTSICKTLERVLNMEISVKKETEAVDMLNEYKNLPREVDPLLLAQPRF